MIQRSSLFALVLLPLAVACSGGGGDSTDARDPAFVSECSGKYLCLITAATDPTQATFNTELSASGKICRADQLFDLYADGSVAFNSALAQPPGTWTGNHSQFSACFSNSKSGCLECRLVGSSGAPATSSAASHCVGTAYDCDSFGASCFGQLGCYMQTSVVSSVYDKCAGSVTECKDIPRKDFCNQQSGCSWQ